MNDFGKILYLRFKGRYYFDMIIDGIKKEEYREIKPFWTSRLDGKTFDTVCMQLGIRKDSPKLYVECLSIIKGGDGVKEWGFEGNSYRIQLGKILKIENYER